MGLVPEIKLMMMKGPAKNSGPHSK